MNRNNNTILLGEICHKNSYVVLTSVSSSEEPLRLDMPTFDSKTLGTYVSDFEMNACPIFTNCFKGIVCF